MKPGCRVMGLLLVGLALFQSVAVLFDLGQAGRWPHYASEWVRLGLLPVALWVFVRYFSVWGDCECGDAKISGKHKTLF